jgi:ribosomal protein S18 acetylase RimI-like enzyme
MDDAEIMLEIRIEQYKDSENRAEVMRLWKDVFAYQAAHNEPGLVIDRKLDLSDGLFFVALDEQGVIGTVMAGYDGHRGWIYTLAVAPACRKRRIGTALLKHAENELERLGCVKINLQILEENREVEAFYLANGYKTEKRINMGKRLIEYTEKS